MFKSIRLRLLALLSSVFLLVMLDATYNAYERRQADTRAVHERLRAQAKIIAEQQSDSARRTERFLEFMVSTMSASSLAEDPACPAKMGTYIVNDPYLANVFIVDPRGRVICNARPVTKLVNLGDRDYFQRALHTPDVVRGDPVYGRITNRWVLPYAKRQVDRAGQVTAVVVASLDLEWVNNSFSQIAAKSPGLRLGLFTSDGLVLARQPDPENWIGKNISRLPAFSQLESVRGDGSVETISHDGEKRIYAFTPFVKTVNEAIYLWITVPKAEATALADRQLVEQALVILVVSALSFGLIWTGAYRFLVRPIESISRAAAGVARGEHGVRTGLSHTDGEFGQLAMAFDDMIFQLDRFDAMTGLLNLPTFEASVDAMLGDLQGDGQGRGLIRLNISALGQVEATFGMAAGMEAIKHFASLLTRAIGTRGLLCRIGEGNFAIAVAGPCDAAATSALIDELGAMLARHPLRVGDDTMEWKVNCAAAFFPVDGRRAADLLRNTGAALAQVQGGAPIQLRFFEQLMNDRLLQRMRRVAALKRAIEEDGLEQHYQPQVDLRTGRLLGFEALLRWKHGDEGYIPPLEFIGLAEETGLILPLGDWVMRQAMRQLVTWRHAHPQFASLVMAINVSGVQFAAPGFIGKLGDALAATGAPPDRIELEITESQLMNLSGEVQLLMRQLKGLGVLLSIDDFGTGYSSLAYLKYFSVDRLKIDKCFIDNLTPGSDDAAIVEATIAMGHKLGLDIIAEGIESRQHVDLLRAMGCDQAQGYFISRPMAAPDAEAFALRAFAEAGELSDAQLG